VKSISKLLIIVLFVNYTYAGKYKFGDKGGKIKEIQTTLASLGYLPDIDGKYGIKTKFAVIAFQKVNRIQTDGIIGAETLATLKNPLIPQSRFKSNEKHIEVDIKLQVLYIVENGKLNISFLFQQGKITVLLRANLEYIDTKKDGIKL